VATFDRVFASYVTGRAADLDVPPASLQLVRPVPVTTADGADSPADPRPSDEALTASAVEVLRHRDLAGLDAADRALAARLLRELSMTADVRRGRRTRPAPHGRLDRDRTLRRVLRAGGEPALPAAHRRRSRPRRVVLLVDVSGSMAAYADALLRFAHAARRGAGSRAEVFTLGTRLTRVTRELASYDPDVALAAVAAAVPDWSGGTRLGELLKTFLDQWGRRGLARGAVVVVLSDGWERGDAQLLGTQMAQLHLLAHRVIWANPRAGRPGFAPLAAGMAAALPHVDDLVAGHSVAALERLAKVVAGSAHRAVAYA
jgi:uncharacterized protein with von Willebrand factor type A (vWA) domain